MSRREAPPALAQDGYQDNAAAPGGNVLRTKAVLPEIASGMPAASNTAPDQRAHAQLEEAVGVDAHADWRR